MAKAPEYFGSSLTLDSSSHVDTLVSRCQGDLLLAERIVHSMLVNYLHFEEMRRAKDAGRIFSLQLEKRRLQEDLKALDEKIEPIAERLASPVPAPLPYKGNPDE
jgi:hypothetical protein